MLVQHILKQGLLVKNGNIYFNKNSISNNPSGHYITFSSNFTSVEKYFPEQILAK